MIIYIIIQKKQHVLFWCRVLFTLWKIERCFICVCVDGGWARMVFHSLLSEFSGCDVTSLVMWARTIQIESLSNSNKMLGTDHLQVIIIKYCKVYFMKVMLPCRRSSELTLTWVMFKSINFPFKKERSH